MNTCRFPASPARRVFAALLPLAFALPAHAQVRETVVQDTPGRLVVEFRVENAAVADGVGGARIVVPGVGGFAEPGSPNLPVHRFRVATGDRTPRVSVEPLEWVDFALPGVLAGVPRHRDLYTAEPVRDAARFAAVRSLAPVLSEPIVSRGIGLRMVELPLAVLPGGAGATTARVPVRFRVQVDFPDPAAAPSPGMRRWLEHAGVLNLAGGAYLVSRPARAPLARSAAAPGYDPLEPRLEITIGDRELDSFLEDGIYALTYAQASAAGVPSGVEVANLRMYAGPKDTGSVVVGPLVGPTLREIPLEVRDANSNGIFDAGDSVLFFAHGTSIWEALPGDEGEVHWRFKTDPWSFHNRYYLQWSPAAGARLSVAAPVATTDTVTTAPHYLRAERHLASGSCDLAGLYDDEVGYVWHWYRRYDSGCNNAPDAPGLPSVPVISWAQLRRPTTDSLPGLVPDTVLFGFDQYRAVAANHFTVWSSDTLLPYAFQGNSARGAWYRKISRFSGNSTGLDSIRWNAGSHVRFLGYTVRYTRALNGRPAHARVVFPARRGQPVAYRMTGMPAGLRVLRVEDGVGARWLPVAQAGAAQAFADSVADGEDVLYYLHAGAPLSLVQGALRLDGPPTANGVVRDLRTGATAGGAGQNPEYLILAPEALLAEAVRLRDYRDDAARDRPYRTAVVRLEDVYREWSGGRMSPVAIRDFLRWALNRWGPGETQGDLSHVLLFGDGHYDYRDIRNGVTLPYRPNHVPPFNWLSSDFVKNPMSSDDFYAVLDAGANWESAIINHAINIGRLSVQTPAQARDYLEKVARYESPASAGVWRSRILYMADDATQRRQPGGVDPIPHHVRQTERVGNQILAQRPGMRPEKLYQFDYPFNASFLKPEATQDLLALFNRGVLFSTFFGHGAHNQLTDEVLLKSNDGLMRLRNSERNFFMTIFSCTVGRFDKLLDEGMGEQFLRQRDHGAIGSIAGTRETFPGDNEELAKAFVAHAFQSNPDSLVRTTGEALRLAKQQVGGREWENTQKYVLLGEPVLALQRRTLGLQLTEQPDTLRALACGTVRGTLAQGSGKGAVNIRIVAGDVPKSYVYRIHANNPDIVDTTTVQKRGQLLFERTVPYTGSTFEVGYFMPRDVPFGDTTAQLQVYAWDSAQSRESIALVRNLVIAGTADSSCIEDDRRGPRITVTGCNAPEAGSVDFPDRVRIGLPYCLQIAVADSGAGVLAAEGPDQGTTVEVVGSIAPFQPQAGVDELFEKTYQLPLSRQDLAPGTHLLRVTARDGFGNLSERQVTLEVGADTVFRFVRAFNTPNPMRDAGTTFWFSASLPVEEGFDLTSVDIERIRFDLRIFNQQGRMVQEFRDAKSGQIRWNGRDAWGRQLANGVYFYEVTATWPESKGAPSGGRSLSRRNTLVISR